MKRQCFSIFDNSWSILATRQVKCSWLLGHDKKIIKLQYSHALMNGQFSRTRIMNYNVFSYFIVQFLVTLGGRIYENGAERFVHSCKTWNAKVFRMFETTPMSMFDLGLIFRIMFPSLHLFRSQPQQYHADVFRFILRQLASRQRRLAASVKMRL